MHELIAVLAGAAELHLRRAPAALATVVETRGSVYRRPGAHMLIGEGSPLAGSVSGGCLEQDVAERAQEVIAGGSPCVLTYDTLSGEDIVWGLGLGCNGVVSILLEPLTPEMPVLQFWQDCMDLRLTGIVATVFRSIEGGPPIGSRAYFSDLGTRIPAGFPDGLARAAEDVGRNGRYQAHHYDGIGILFEVIAPPTRLVICGAGSDAMPLVRIAKEVGWEVLVVDRRPAYARAELFPLADRVVLSRPSLMGEHLSVSARDAAVVMAHNVLDDEDYLRVLLGTQVPYIGVLGPRQRTERFLASIDSTLDRSRVFAPVGLDIGAETAEEIALSIVAEIRAVQADRRSGFLRERAGPIHHSEKLVVAPSRFENG
jgi:xanthine dehydrogenase accessory factor